MFVRLEQRENTSSPIVVTWPGMFTLVKLVQDRHAKFPIEVTWLPIVRLVRRHAPGRLCPTPKSVTHVMRLNCHLCDEPMPWAPSLPIRPIVIGKGSDSFRLIARPIAPAGLLTGDGLLPRKSGLTRFDWV
jgi:hypothetical protein